MKCFSFILGDAFYFQFCQFQKQENASWIEKNTKNEFVLFKGLMSLETAHVYLLCSYNSWFLAYSFKFMFCYFMLKNI